MRLRRQGDDGTPYAWQKRARACVRRHFLSMTISPSEHPYWLDRRTDPDSPGAWTVLAIRLGYAAKGVVYTLVGLLALLTAVGLAERAAGSFEVFALIGRLPLGRALLTLVALGLLGYAALSLAGAVRERGTLLEAGRGLLLRLTDAATGAIYLGLTVVALRLVIEPTYQSERLGERLARLAFDARHGALLVGAAGAAVVGLGLYLLWRAAAHGGGETLDRRLLGERAQRVAGVVGRIGGAARGLFFALFGVLVIDAARRSDPSQVRDVGEALGALARMRAGPLLLGVVAVGFIAYGAYQLVKARYRRTDLP